MLIAVGQRFVAAGNEAAWESLWQQLNVLAERQSGFISSRLLRSEEHQSKYVLINEWEREEDWSRYFHEAEVQDLMQQSYRLFSGPPLQEWFVTLAESNSPTSERR
jgi:heme-degrading monooxygenase HmoA